MQAPSWWGVTEGVASGNHNTTPWGKGYWRINNYGRDSFRKRTHSQTHSRNNFRKRPEGLFRRGTSPKPSLQRTHQTNPQTDFRILHLRCPVYDSHSLRLKRTHVAQTKQHPRRYSCKSPSRSDLTWPQQRKRAANAAPTKKHGSWRAKNANLIALALAVH